MESVNYIPRKIEEYAFDENLFDRHMVFLAGPRQVEKTCYKNIRTIRGLLVVIVHS
jgi:hypothetical protein